MPAGARDSSGARGLSQAQRDMNAVAAKVGRGAVVFKDMQL